MANDTLLNGRRILVVEDMLMIAEAIGDGLAAYGCEVIGPVGRLERGLALAREAPLDLAVLDVNLAGKSSFPIAEVLARRGIPFLFVTGYGDDAVLPLAFRRAPRLAKPFHMHDLAKLIAACFGVETC